MKADPVLASTLRLINRQSNIFRAEARVLVLDSLSGWLCAWAFRAREAGWEPGTAEPDSGDSLRDVRTLCSVLRANGIIVTEEAAAVGLAPDKWDRWYAAEMSKAIRRLAEQSLSVYRLTAGMAVDVKGNRVKRRNPKNEHLYTDRR